MSGAPALHPVEKIAVARLRKAGGWTVEHVGPASWRLNGVLVDRWLFVEIGWMVREGRALPARWLAKVAGERRAA